MIVPSNYTQLLENGRTEINGVAQPNMIIKVLPGKLSDATKTNLKSWTV